MDFMKSRPHAAVHTGAQISLLRCTSQASTRVVTNKQDNFASSLEFTVCSKLD